MYKKTSKSLVFFGMLLVFSILLASCQSMITSNEEMERTRVLEAWGAYLTGLGKRYREETGQASTSLLQLRSDVPPQEQEMSDVNTPGVEINRIRLAENYYITEYRTITKRPAWVVFHKDENGKPGDILEYVFVESGDQSIHRTEFGNDVGSEQTHVMLHEDFGTTALFEYPGPDSPVYVEDEIVNELCFCPY